MVIAIAAAGLVLASVVTAEKANRASGEFALLEANAEALVQGETAQGICYKDISAAEGIYVAYCGTCTWLKGRPSSDEIGFCF